MSDAAHSYALELLAAVEPVHRDFAHRGAVRFGLPFDEMFNALVAHFLETLPRYDPARGPVHRFAEWQARTVIGARQKHERRWTRQVTLPPDEPRLERLTDDGEDPAAIAEREELLGLVRDEFEELTAKQRAALDLYFGLTSGSPMGGDAVAAAVCRNASCVNERINRGLRHLALAVGADPACAAMSRRAAMFRA